MSTSQFAALDLRVKTTYQAMYEQLGSSISQGVMEAHSQYLSGVSDGATLADKVDDLNNYISSLNEFLGSSHLIINSSAFVPYINLYNQVDTELAAITKRGFPGIQGSEGPAGREGDQGIMGRQGLQGPRGPVGARGPDGIPGGIVIIGENSLPASKIRKDTGPFDPLLIPENLSNYAKPSDIYNLANIYQPVGNYASLSAVDQLENFVNQISSIYQPLGDYITSLALEDKGYLTSISALSTFQERGNYAQSSEINLIQEVIGDVTNFPVNPVLAVSSLQKNLSKLVGEYTFDDVLNTVAESLGVASNSDFIHKISVDFAPYSATNLVSLFLNSSSGVDAADVVTRMYRNGTTRSSTPGTAEFMDYLHKYGELGHQPQEIKDNFLNLINASNSVAEMVDSVLGLIGASDDIQLRNNLIIGFNYSLSFTYANNFSNLRTAVGNALRSTSIFTIVFSFFLFIKQPYQAAKLILKNISLDSQNNNIAISSLVDNLKNSLALLQDDDITINNLASNIASSINAANDEDLIAKFVLNFNSDLGIHPSDVREGFSNLVGNDAIELASSLNSIFANLGALSTYVSLGQELLYWTIENKINNGISSSLIISNLQSSIANLSDNDSYKDVATAMAKALDMEDNYNLMNALEFDLYTSSYFFDPGRELYLQSGIKANVNQISGVKAENIVESIYHNLQITNLLLPESGQVQFVSRINNYKPQNIVEQVEYLSNLVTSYQDNTISVQLGTLGSFYACDKNSVYVSTIAVGSSTIAGTLLAQKQCNKWAFEAATSKASQIFVGISNADYNTGCINIANNYIIRNLKIVNPSHEVIGEVPIIGVNCEDSLNCYASLKNAHFTSSQNSFYFQDDIKLVCSYSSEINCEVDPSMNYDYSDNIISEDQDFGLYLLEEGAFIKMPLDYGAFNNFCNYALDN